MTTAKFNVSMPIVFEDGTMQYPFRDFMLRVDAAIDGAGISASWGNITGTLSDQTDVQAAIDAAAATAVWGGITGTLSDQTDLQSAIDAAEITTWGDIIGTLSNQTDLNLALEAKAARESGFVDRFESTMYFEESTRTFTIDVDFGSFNYYQDGVLYTKTSAETVVISDVEGLHFIYYNGSTLSETTTFTETLITTYALVSVIYWDATNSEAIMFGDERHGMIMDSSVHAYNHLTIGARYQSGLGLGNMDVDGSGNDASAAQLSVADGYIWDEDIQHRIYYNYQVLSPIAEIPMYYRSGAGGDWRRVDATTYPITTTGTGRAAWNEDTGATWQLTEVGSNNYVLTHYYATNNLYDQIIGLVGQEEYTTVGNAREGAVDELNLLSLGPLAELTPEFVPIASVIWQTTNTYSNAVKSRVRSTDEGDDYIDWRSSKGSGGGTSGGTTDIDAIHNNVPAEISAIAEKATPVAGDWLLAEDSADSDAKVKVQIGNLPGGGGGSGTVTSVAVSGSDGIEVDSGSPITTSGTIALGVNAGTMRTTINVEDGSTADQTDGEIETAYNNQVAVVSTVDAEAGTSTDVYRWTPERVAEAIAALGGGGGSAAYASFYTTTGGVTAVSTTPLQLVIGSTRVNSGDFTLATNDVTIDKTGTFEITFDCYFNNSSTSRSEYSKYMEVDTGGGFVEAAASRFATYQRGYDSGHSASMTLIDDFTDGDIIRFMVVRTDGGATVGYQDANGTRLTIREV